MRLFVDLDTLVVSDYRGSDVRSIPVRRSDRFPVEVRFQSGVVKELPHGATGRIVIKKTADFSGNPVAWSPAWRRVGAATAAYYLFQLNLHTQQVLEEFQSLQGELPSVTFAFEIQWEHRGVRRSSRAVALVVENDYVRLEDGAEPPVPLDEAGPPVEQVSTGDYKATRELAEEGLNNETWMTPLRTAQAIAAAGGETWEGLEGKPLTFPPATHTHLLSHLSRSGAETGQVATWDGVSWVPGSTAWEGISDKPATFPPEEHGHSLSDLSASGAAAGQVPAWNGAAWVPQTPEASWNDLTDKPTAFPSTIADVSGLETALEGKQAAGTYAAASHPHSASDITSGTLAIARLPTGTTGSTVALGNHTHSDYVSTSGGVAAIAVVATMPAAPSPTTLYIVTG